MRAPVLESDRLHFEALGQNHLSSKYVDWMNDKEINKYLESGGDYTLDKLKDFLKNLDQNPILFWAIRIKDSGKQIGNIKIDPINKRNQTGEYGILLGDKKEWGKGYAKEASLRVIDFCFSDSLNLRKITLGVVEDNLSALLLYKSIGFIQEGLLKGHSLHEGKWCNVIRMARFNSKFEF
jgi:RimJ/RimL family protein N-acetyltransferase